MPDDPKKPAPPQTPVEQMSYEDYKKQLEATLSNGGGQDGQPAAPPKPSPVKQFFGDVLQRITAPGGVGPTQDAEFNRSMGRGMADAGIEALTTIGEGAAWVDRKTGLGELIEPGYNKAYDDVGARGMVSDIHDKAKAAQDHFMGKRSDDFLAGFTEDTANFLTGFYATGELKALRGMKTLAELEHGSKLLRVGVGMARGAAVDATSFDPYQAQLAEVAARYGDKVPGLGHGLQELGKALAVDPNDNAAVARFKRAAGGVIAGTAVEALAAGAKLASPALKKLLTSGSKADQSLALATVRENAGILEDFSNGTLKPADDPIHVTPHGVGEDGEQTFTAVVNEKHPGVQKEVEAIRALKKEKPAPVEAKAQTPEEILTEQEMRKQGIDPNAPPKASAPSVSSPSDEARVRGEAMRDDPAANPHNNLPVWTNKAEADQAVHSMNEALRPKLAGPVGPKDVSELVEKYQKLLAAGPEKVREGIEEVGAYNPKYAQGPDKTVAMIHAVTQQIADHIGNAQASTTVEKAITAAREALGNLPSREAPKVIADKLGRQLGDHVWTLMGDMELNRSAGRIAQLADMIEARPHDDVLSEEAARLINDHFELQASVFGSNSEHGRSMRMLQERNRPEMRDLSFAEGKAQMAGEELPKAGEVVPKKGNETERPMVAGMGTRKILPEDAAAVARMFKIAEGDLKNLEAVKAGAKVYKKTGLISAAMEVMANGMLSGPKTAETVISSGVNITGLQNLIRMGAGVTTGNKELVREGADMMLGNIRYLQDNVASMWASLKAGRSIIDPQPQHIAIGGYVPEEGAKLTVKQQAANVVGNVIRSPGRALTGLDEFTRVTNYRSFIYAKSAKLARAQGLTGRAFEERIAADLRAAFDPETGLATVPTALKYAEVPTLSGPLRSDSFGKAFLDFTNNRLEAKFIAPFVKATANMMDYVWQGTPYLNRYNSEARRIMDAGGEEAAVLQARTRVSGVLYAYGLYQASVGNITGRGPSDPKLRALWLKDHQPYSIRVGAENSWHSYQRFDPLSMPLGLMADGVEAAKEVMDSEDHDATDVLYAAFASLTINLGNKSYMQGMTNFFKAFGDSSGNGMKRYMQQFAVGFTPFGGAMRAANSDPYYRDARTLMDKFRAQIPGLSDNLPAMRNWAGEKVMKDNWSDRSLALSPTQEASSNVESEMVSLGKGIGSAPRKIARGLIDLSDKTWVSPDPKLAGMTPYERMNDLIANGVDGRPGLRSATEELVKSKKYLESGSGDLTNKGGEKFGRIAGLVDEYRGRALKQVLREYPSLRDAYKAQMQASGRAVMHGSYSSPATLMDMVRSQQ